MQLHDRLFKGELLPDVDLLFLDVRGILIYQALIQLAEDSGCEEFHPLQIKAVAFPMRDEVTVELIDGTGRLLQAHRMIVLYKVGTPKTYYYVKGFHKHQVLRSPRPPQTPLPHWVRFEKPDDRKYNRGRFYVDESKIPAGSESEICTIFLENCTTSYSDSYSYSESGSGKGGAGGKPRPVYEDGTFTECEDPWAAPTKEFQAAFPFPGQKFESTRRILMECAGRLGHSPEEVRRRITELFGLGMRQVKPWQLWEEGKQDGQGSRARVAKDPNRI